MATRRGWGFQSHASIVKNVRVWFWGCVSEKSDVSEIHACIYGLSERLSEQNRQDVKSETYPGINEAVTGEATYPKSGI